MKIVTAFLSLTLLVSFAAARAANVGQGSISGVVIDQSGAVVPGATVVVTSVLTGVKEARVTNSSGFYLFPTLLIGHYKIEIRKQGFRTYHQVGLTINVNSELRVNATLQVGSQNQSITVQSATVPVNTVSTQKGDVITGQEVRDLPLINHNALSLLTLQPGIVYGKGGVSVEGQKGVNNGYYLNGMESTNPYDNSPLAVPDLESIAQFRVLTSNMYANYGNYIGGMVQLVTRAGTNKFHGDLFEYFRNQDFNARNFYASGTPPYHYNDFGGSLGGPIRRNKVFFFADYEGNRNIIAPTTPFVALPSREEHLGDFSAVASQLSKTVTGFNWADMLSARLGYTVSPNEPYYVSGCKSTAQCVFPGAIIPQRAMSPIAQKLEKYIPIPASNGLYNTSSYANRGSTDNFSGRVDATTRWGTFGAYYFQHTGAAYSPFGVSTFPTFGGSKNSDGTHLATASYTKAFGSNAVNQLQWGYARTSSEGPYPWHVQPQTLASLGFAPGSDLGIVAMYPSQEEVPVMSFYNWSFGGPIPSRFVTNVAQVTDDYSRVVGHHTFKFGGAYHDDEVNQLVNGNNNGTFGFRGQETGSDFADFLLGAPGGYSQGAEKPLYERTYYLALFAQDSWRVKKNLTLNYGLRWDLNPPWSEKYNTFNSLIPGEKSKVYPGAPVGWVFPGDPGVPPTISPIRYRNFEPRIGLAYAPGAQSGLLRRLLGSSGKSSIRAGFGVYYTEVMNFGTRMSVGNAPFGMFYATGPGPLLAQPFRVRWNGAQQNGYGQPFPPPALYMGEASVSHPNNQVNWGIYTPIGGNPVYYHNNETPMGEDYSFSVERQFGRNNLLEVAYVGKQGHHEPTALVLDPANPALCLSVSQPSEVMPGTPTCGPDGEHTTYFPVTGGKINGTRAIGQHFLSIGGYTYMGNSNYNSMQVSWRHTSNRFFLRLGYTYSKCMSDNNDISTMVNPFNYRLSKALCAWNVEHQLVASVIYNVPLESILHFHGRVSSALLGGWKVSGDTIVVTGNPLYLYENDDRSLSGAWSGGMSADMPDLPNFTPGSLNLNHDGGYTGQTYFNTSLFSLEPLGKFGTASRMFFPLPTTDDTDLALLKNVRFTESKSLQLRLDAHDAFNDPQIGGIVGNFLAPNFGHFTQALNQRTVQIAAKLIF